MGKVRKTFLKAFNTGVFVLIPIVVVGGVFLAFSLATGTAGKTVLSHQSFDAEPQPYWYGWHQDDDSSPCCPLPILWAESLLWLVLSLITW